MSKPRIISPCVAERYARDTDSRIAEFSTALGGGLIEVRNGDTGPTVSLYRCGPTVTIVTDVLTLREKELIENLKVCLSCLTPGRDDKEAKAARALIRRIEG